MNRIGLILVGAALTAFVCCARTPRAAPVPEAPAVAASQPAAQPAGGAAVSQQGNYDQWDFKPHKDNRSEAGPENG